MSTFRKTVSRRALFGLAARAIALVSGIGLLVRPAAALAASSPGQSRGRDGVDILAGFIRQLFPHRGLDGDYYSGCATKVKERAAAIPGIARQLQDGIARLDSQCGKGGWAGAAGAARIAAMQKLEKEPFFQFVRSSSLELIYRDPRVWDQIGYGGNALKKGGYLHQGFNDINWLPREQKR